MLFILYIAAVSAILLFVVLNIIENMRIKKRNILKEKRYDYIKNRFFGKVVICTIFIFVVLYGFTWTVWISSPKEGKTVEKITDSNELYPLQDVDGTYYLGVLTDNNGKQKYVVNMVSDSGVSQQILDPKAVETVNADSSVRPVYQKVAEYKDVKLKTDKFKALRDSVNDMYGYISGYKETKVSEKIKLIIPKGTIMNDYGVTDSGTKKSD
ncbi:MAG: hypothetical protein Q8900_06975 [Bacillota bacterium]|nr:hypothetical protein [Bacillota bacterium]